MSERRPGELRGDQAAAVTMSIFVMLILLLYGSYLITYTMDFKYLMLNKPGFDGVVTGITEDYIVVELDEDEPLYEEYPVILVARQVLCTRYKQSFDIGDRVQPHYEGYPTDDDPPRLEVVYYTLLMDPANPPSE